MNGQIGSQFGGCGLFGLIWIALWLWFGPIMFLILLFRQPFRERQRNLWLTAGITVAPFALAELERLLG